MKEHNGNWDSLLKENKKLKRTVEFLTAFLIIAATIYLYNNLPDIIEGFKAGWNAWFGLDSAKKRPPVKAASLILYHPKVWDFLVAQWVTFEFSNGERLVGFLQVLADADFSILNEYLIQQGAFLEEFAQTAHGG
jgi:hypothetical protein